MKSKIISYLVHRCPVLDRASILFGTKIIKAWSVWSLKAIKTSLNRSSNVYCMLEFPLCFFQPKTEKQNAIIEKTASFIAKQGSQMEIVIKTKQKNNAQFDFLNYENILNRYYKHMIKLIKNGRYTPKPAQRKRTHSGKWISILILIVSCIYFWALQLLMHSLFV